MILIKPSKVPVGGIYTEITAASELNFPKFQSKETETFVGLEFKDFEGIFKVTAENFVAIAKYLGTWDFRNWVGSSIRIYQETKLIGENNILMLRVGEVLKRKKVGKISSKP